MARFPLFVAVLALFSFAFPSIVRITGGTFPPSAGLITSGFIGLISYFAGFRDGRAGFTPRIRKKQLEKNKS